MTDNYGNTAYNYPTNNRKVWLRRIIFVFVVVAILVVAVVFLVTYLTTGKVVIRSSDGNAKITLTSIASGKQMAAAKGELTATEHTGAYSADVTTSTGETQQIVNIKAHSTSSYTINPIKTTGFEPVSDSAATDITASSAKLFFLNNDGQLSSIDSANSLSVVNTHISFSSLQWADSSYGVGQDQNGNLYEVDNGTISPLTLNSGTNHNPSLYAVAPNHQLYVSIGKAVYSVGAGDKLQKIYSADYSPTLLLAGNNKVVVVCNNSSGSKQKSPLAIVNRGGGEVAKKYLPGVFVGALSPDEKYIAVSTPNGGEVLDTKLDKTADLTVTKPGITTPVWIDSSTLVYGNGGDLWHYNVTTQASQLLAVAPDNGTINELSLSDDAGYVYGGVTHIGGLPVIKRLGLHHQAVPSFLYKLQPVMPYSGNDYFMTLTNFTSPVITVQPFTPLTNTNEQYLQEATGELKKLGIDPAQINLKLVIP